MQANMRRCTHSCSVVWGNIPLHTNETGLARLTSKQGTTTNRAGLVESSANKQGSAVLLTLPKNRAGLTGKQGLAVLDMACVQAQVGGLQPEDELHLVQLVQLLTDDAVQLAQGEAAQLEEEGRVEVPKDGKAPG